jgi:hypothetical protein
VTPRLAILLSRIAQPRVALNMARRWGRARHDCPDLARDVAQLGAVYVPAGAPPDAQRLAYEAGRRDLALEVLALMGLTPDEINHLSTLE